MQNTGTWNSDFCIFLLIIMFLPSMLFFIVQIINSFNIFDIAQENSEINFDAIKKTAMQQAVEGNNAARNWVTKHVFNEQQDKAKSATLLTSQKVIEDTMAALTAVKYKKADVKAVVYQLGSEKKYTDVGAMVLDCIKEL
jgi:Holliday junction resolvasome RuvABC DNA-binding subunit